MKKSFYTIGLILLLALDSSAFSTKTIKSDPKNIIKADKILYDSNTNILEAIGNVRLVNGNYYVAADMVVVNRETKEIWVDKRFYAEGAKARLIADYFYNNEKDHILHLKNAMVEFNDSDIILAKEIKSSEDGIFKINKGTFSSCKACINQHPIWQIQADESYLDTKTQRVIYKNTRFLIGKQTIMYWPFFSHYLKGAEAQSGILMPSNYHSSLRVPLYLRLRPNIDATYTPRFMKKNLIHELEFRHLLKNGCYTIYHSHMHGGSLTENPKSKSDRFHSKISGNYHTSWADYEYLYENISDVSYLKNYYYDNRPYLKSYIYGQQLDSHKQISIGVKKYKGLRSIDSNETDPYLGPVLYARERLDFENGWSFLAADEFMRYSEKHKNIVRNNLTMSLSRFFYGNIGQQVNISLTNFLDFYTVEKLQKTRVSIRNKTAIRNTPELQIGG
ncbi:MAG: LPS-assembly protein LptD, partial [Alphaproteobacteria bacterium]|nr:LPS-assembly protein LptD [Alphaproteobacteria bacterium]